MSTGSFQLMITNSYKICAMKYAENAPKFVVRRAPAGHSGSLQRLQILYLDWELYGMG